MPKLNLTEQHKIALTAALALAIGAGVTSALDEDAGKPKPIAEVAKSTKLDPSLVVDTAKYHAAIMAAKEQAGPDVVDLLSAPCDPGATCTTGVNLPFGSTLADVELIGAAVGAFNVMESSCTDGEEAATCTVTATNISDKAQRLTALVRVN